MLQSRVVLGCGYGLAAALTGLAILLAASPPSTGPLGPASQLILTVLGLNLVLILALTVVVALRIAALLDARQSDAGARLQLRFVTLFALAAVAPAVVVALFYGVLVSRGVEDWFSHRVQTVVENSATVARSYMEEQRRYIGDHVTLMGADLNRAAPALRASPITFSHFLANLASYHAFPAAYLIDRDGRVLARAEAADAPPLAAPPPSALQGRRRGRHLGAGLRFLGPDARGLPPAGLSGRLPLCDPAGGEGDPQPLARRRGVARRLSRGRAEPRSASRRPSC